jgi:hypothetical protein
MWVETDSGTDVNVSLLRPSTQCLRGKRFTNKNPVGTLIKNGKVSQFDVKINVTVTIS